MICEHCIHDCGKGFYCMMEHYVDTGLEATDCDDYLYNGECNE